MPVDLVKKVSGLQRAYVGTRGADRAKGLRGPSGSSIAVPGSLIPRTTWGDVVVVAAHVDKYADPTPEQCLDLLEKHLGYNRATAAAACAGWMVENPIEFKKTLDFKRAKADFAKHHPLAVSQRLAGGFSNWTFMARKIAEGGVFPNNEQFWGYVNRYAKARSAADAVPFWDEIAVESVSEAIKELPDTVSKAMRVVDPRSLVPDVSGIVALIKWGSIAGAVGLLYWYVLKK